MLQRLFFLDLLSDFVACLLNFLELEFDVDTLKKSSNETKISDIRDVTL